MDRITVIVPFYNAEEWLPRCLDSLTKQDGDLDFILVNDHSTDKSKEIAYEYCNRDKRFVLMNNMHAKGVSGARNTGLDYADGEWVTFLDADDYLAENATEAWEDALQWDANIHQLNHLRWYGKKGMRDVRYANPVGYYDLERLPSMWCMVWNKLYRRERYDSVRFKEGLQYGEDELYNLACFAIDDRIHNSVSTAMVHCFDNKGSLSKVKKDIHLWKQIRALEEFLESQTDPKVRCAVCKVLGEHWASDTFLKHIGHRE